MKKFVLSGIMLTALLANVSLSYAIEPIMIDETRMQKVLTIETVTNKKIDKIQKKYEKILEKEKNKQVKRNKKLAKKEEKNQKKEDMKQNKLALKAKKEEEKQAIKQAELQLKEEKRQKEEEVRQEYLALKAKKEEEKRQEKEDRIAQKQAIKEAKILEKNEAQKLKEDIKQTKKEMDENKKENKAQEEMLPNPKNEENDENLKTATTIESTSPIKENLEIILSDNDSKTSNDEIIKEENIYEIKSEEKIEKNEKEEIKLESVDAPTVELLDKKDEDIKEEIIQDNENPKETLDKKEDIKTDNTDDTKEQKEEIITDPSQYRKNLKITDIDNSATSVNEFLGFTKKQNEKFSLFYYKTISELELYEKQIKSIDEKIVKIKKEDDGIKTKYENLKKLDRQRDFLMRERDTYYNKALQKFTTILTKKQAVKWELLQQMGYRFLPKYD